MSIELPVDAIIGCTMLKQGFALPWIAAKRSHHSIPVMTAFMGSQIVQHFVERKEDALEFWFA